MRNIFLDDRSVGFNLTHDHSSSLFVFHISTFFCFPCTPQQIRSSQNLVHFSWDRSNKSRGRPALSLFLRWQWDIEKYIEHLICKKVTRTLLRIRVLESDSSMRKVSPVSTRLGMNTNYPRMIPGGAVNLTEPKSIDHSSLYAGEERGGCAVIVFPLDQLSSAQLLKQKHAKARHSCCYTTSLRFITSLAELRDEYQTWHSNQSLSMHAVSSLP